jgi:glycosyltransferase involved in cell wall biosynthesis
MNILFITHYSKLYGANRSLLLLLKGLKEKNINLLVFLPKAGPLTNELQKLSIPFRKLRFCTWMGVRNKFFFLEASLRFLINLLIFPVLALFTVNFKPSLIYTNSSTSPIGIYLALIFRKPHIWHIRELGKLDYNLEYDFGRKYFNFFMNKSDAIICISDFVKANLFKGYRKNVSVINNAVYSDNDLKILNAKQLTEKNNVFTFLIMSIVHPSKGIHDAIEALAKIKKEYQNIKLVICGGDEDKHYRRNLNELISRLELAEIVSFMGFVEKPPEMYKIADAVLICSRNEAWGRVAAEAMIFEKPVIGYKGGGTLGIISDKENGLLYENIEGLANCMRLVMQDKELVSKLTNNARRFALKRFNQSVYVENIFQVITETVKVPIK